MYRLWFSAAICFILFQISTTENNLGRNQNVCEFNDVLPLQVKYCDLNDNRNGNLMQVLHTNVEVGTPCVFQNKNATWTIKKICNVNGWHDTDIYNAVPTSKDAVFYSHGGRVKRFLGFFAVGIAVVGAVTLFAGQHASRDNTKPKLVCPTLAPKLADPIQVNTIVTWTEPFAHDETDGQLSTRRGGSAPGWLFSEGVTSVKYSARDNSGNSNSCNVIIKVVVARCPVLSPIKDGYYICHPSSDMVQETMCNFGCYHGHRLQGATSITCIGHVTSKVGHWTNKQPICERLKCPTLPPAIKPLHMTCTDKNYYRSICRFTCDKGFDITPGQTRVLLCTEYGQWRGSIPTCRDSEPPSFKNCIGYQIGFADRGSTTARLSTFQSPLVVDNNAKNIVPKLKTRNDPENRLKIGVYDIIYEAEDDAGNKATDCKIKLVVKMITCPKIYPTAETYVICSTGSRYGSNCDFSCESSATLNGSQSVVCERHRQDPFGYWTWGEQQPFCQDVKRCTKQLHVPNNGALACDYWLGGKFCQMYCKTNFDIPVGFNIGTNMFVCGESGKWSPSSSLPDCAKVVGSSNIQYRLDLEFRFDGNCHDEDVVLHIQEKFMEYWKTTAYKEGCLHEVEKCVPSNIQVKCGSSGGKRSVFLKIVLDVDMTLPSPVNGDEFANLSIQQYSVLQTMKETINNGNFVIELNENSTLIGTSMKYTSLVIGCVDGTVPTKNHDGCAKCVPGSYFDAASKLCRECPKGTFQDLEGQQTCIKCLANETTRSSGAIDVSQCEEACKPGSWSPNGMPPCSFCPKGSYQDKYGQVQCIECDGSSTTEYDGVSSSVDCQEFDIQINSLSAGIEKELNIPFVSNFEIRLWAKLTDITTNSTILEIEGNQSNLIALNIKEGHLKIQHGFLSKRVNTFLLDKWYAISIQMYQTGIKVISDIDLVVMNVTTNTFPISAKLKIGNGFIGRISQLNVFSGNATGVLSNKCFSDAEGDILSWKSFEEILASDIFVHVPSECDDTNECDNNPCMNGNCTNELNGYSCKCDYGFYGEQCEHNIDDCGDNACDNNGTCVDGPASYTCTCPSHYTGTLCEIKVVDGDWSEWGNWTTCSVTCGNGTQKRARLCNNPTPDNGGMGCIGNSTEYDNCAEESCPACSKIVEPENTILNCVNDTNESINCTLECPPDYGFDHDAKRFYYCGPETLYEWDYQTQDNPLVRLPSCTELKNASSLKVEYHAQYADLTCDLSAAASVAEKTIIDVLQTAHGQIQCLQDGICTVSQMEVVNCSNHEREKRDISFKEAGFKTEYECDAEKYGSEECHTLLLSALETMINQTSLKLLDSFLENQIYPIDVHTLMVDSTVKCTNGMVEIDYRCAPCSKGRFENNGICSLCNVGTYQDNTGQTSCKPCPSGRSTLGKGSLDVTDCTVMAESQIQDIVNGMVIGLVSACCILILVALACILRRYLRKSPKVIDYDFNGIHKCQISAKPVFDKHEMKNMKRIW